MSVIGNPASVMPFERSRSQECSWPSRSMCASAESTTARCEPYTRSCPVKPTATVCSCTVTFAVHLAAEFRQEGGQVVRDEARVEVRAAAEDAVCLEARGAERKSDIAEFGLVCLAADAAAAARALAAEHAREPVNRRGPGALRVEARTRAGKIEAEAPGQLCTDPRWIDVRRMAGHGPGLGRIAAQRALERDLPAEGLPVRIVDDDRRGRKVARGFARERPARRPAGNRRSGDSGIRSSHRPRAARVTR